MAEFDCDLAAIIMRCAEYAIARTSYDSCDRALHIAGHGLPTLSRLWLGVIRKVGRLTSAGVRLSRLTFGLVSWCSPASAECFEILVWNRFDGVCLVVGAIGWRSGVSQQLNLILPTP